MIVGGQQTGLASLGSLVAKATDTALAQRRPAAKMRYNEVVRSMLYTPAYVTNRRATSKNSDWMSRSRRPQDGDKSMPYSFPKQPTANDNTSPRLQIWRIASVVL